MAVWSSGSVRWLQTQMLSCQAENAPSTKGRINLGTKRTGKRSAGNPHAPFDWAGAGNEVMVRSEAPAIGESRRQTVSPLPTAGRASPRPYQVFHRSRPEEDVGAAVVEPRYSCPPGVVLYFFLLLLDQSAFLPVLSEKSPSGVHTSWWSES